MATDTEKFHHFRQLVEAAHRTFHDLTSPDEPTRFQHTPEEDNDPAALMNRIAAARDEARETAEELLEAGEALLALMDEVPINHRLGDETDRVFPRYEFAYLRAAIQKAKGKKNGT